jgi:hypothetical protein
MAPIVVVHLRQPNRMDPNESRTDPLYEFGSFGLTHCHERNLLHDDELSGRRLAFAQNGHLGFRLIMLTPPVTVRELRNVHEALWSPAKMPLRYPEAPLLIDNDGTSDVAGLSDLMSRVDRSTWVSRFSSAFRSRKKPLPLKVASNLVDVWERAYQRARARAQFYWQALPYVPAVLDQDRRTTYERLLKLARGVEAPRPVCRPASAVNPLIDRAPRRRGPGSC